MPKLQETENREVVNPTELGKKIDVWGRLGRMTKDEQVRRGAEAGIRTIVNTLIGVGDFVPVLGEI